MLEQQKTPLFSVLTNHFYQERVSLHVPGHKNGNVFPKIAESWYNNILKIDGTEVGELDDLHDPQGAIEEAQQLAAAYYQSDRTYFLVNGSTVGNLAMILATCNPGDKVFVQRNCHQSIMNGLELAKVHPIFLHPAYDKEQELTVGIEVDTLLQAMKKFPDAKALILTYPSYYGVASKEIKTIIEMAKKASIVVLVDEAHGAHFSLPSPFPPSTLSLGADIVVHSAHKTLPAMTMASYIHVNKNALLSHEKLVKYLQMLQSSSPSYPLMASLDLARFYLAHLKEKDIRAINESIEQFKKQLASFSYWHVVEERDSYFLDPLKVTLNVKGGLSGVLLKKKLEKIGLFPEIANHQQLLFVLPLAPFDAIESVIATLQEGLTHVEITEDRDTSAYFLPPSISELAIPYDKMEQYKTARLAVQDSLSYVIAESITPYPPGIPFLMKGERIDKDRLQQLETMIENGVRFQGQQNIKTAGIQVFI